MDILKKQYFNNEKLFWYMILSATMLAGSLLYFIISRDGYSKTILGGCNFGDYFSHIAMSSDRRNLYSYAPASCFPPLAYCFYYALWRINPFVQQNRWDWEAWKSADNNMLILLMLSILLAFMLFYLIVKFFADDKLSLEIQLILTILILFSYPFFCTSIQRGNSVGFVAILLGYAILLKDFNSKALREVALILIAVSVGFKVYPVFFGLLYLKDRRWKEAFRLTIYGILFFFVPFVFFGGWEGLTLFIAQMLEREQRVVMKWGTIRGIINIFMQEFNVSTELGNSIGIAAEELFLLISIVMFFLCKKKWKSLLYLAGIMMLWVPTNWMYTTTYLLPAFLTFLTEKENTDNRYLNFFYILMLSMIFGLPSFFANIQISNSFDFGIYGGVYTIVYILLFVSLIEDGTKLLKRNRRIDLYKGSELHR